jgi:hypothetical protein
MLAHDPRGVRQLREIARHNEPKNANAQAQGRRHLELRRKCDAILWIGTVCVGNRRDGGIAWREPLDATLRSRLDHVYRS